MWDIVSYVRNAMSYILGYGSHAFLPHFLCHDVLGHFGYFELRLIPKSLEERWIYCEVTLLPYLIVISCCSLSHSTQLCRLFSCLNHDGSSHLLLSVGGCHHSLTGYYCWLPLSLCTIIWLWLQYVCSLDDDIMCDYMM